MFGSVLSAAILGVEAHPVMVEADVSSGLPGFSIVGSASSQVKEAQERVRTALRNTGIIFPPKRITINLAPAAIRKVGNGFDLPVAAAVLLAAGRIPPKVLDRVLIVGELGLDGQVRKVNGVLPMALMARQAGCHVCIVPYENGTDGAGVEGIRLIGIQTLAQLIEFCEHGKVILQPVAEKQKQTVKQPDFADIKGQKLVKRAAVVAAAGFHNLLMTGPPGSGKTMAASRIPTILPPLTQEEKLEVMQIQSIAGILPKGGLEEVVRPFRAPHHTVPIHALVGGGNMPRPGEVTLAHRGVLFLDELSLMPRNVLDALRQPLEEKRIVISRLQGEYCFPADFLFVAAMNACPCGCYPDMDRCSCTQAQIDQYRRRISQPILERMDLTIETDRVPYQAFFQEGRTKEGELTSLQMRSMVMDAHAIQQKRYLDQQIQFNSQLEAGQIGKYCVLEMEAERFLERAAETLKFSVRVCHRILRTARTVADLAGHDRICREDVSEAVCMRGLEQSQWRA